MAPRGCNTNSRFSFGCEWTTGRERSSWWLEDCGTRLSSSLFDCHDLGHRFLRRQPDPQTACEPPNSVWIVLWRVGVPGDELCRDTFVGRPTQTSAASSFSKNLRRTHHHVFCGSANRVHGATTRAIRIKKASGLIRSPLS